MNINKNNLLVAKVASKDVSRPALQSVYFTPTGTAATDGHRFVKIGYPAQEAAAELPETLPRGDASEIVPFLISADQAVILAKSQPKVRHLTCLQNIFIDVAKTNSNGSAHFVTTDLETTARPEIKKLDYQFPPYEQIIPAAGTATLAIRIDPELLRDVCDIAVKLGIAGCKFEFTDCESGVKITGVNPDNDQDFLAVVMPRKL